MIHQTHDWQCFSTKAMLAHDGVIYRWWVYRCKYCPVVRHSMGAV